MEAGFELHIDGEGTQTRTLGQAKGQVRSYVSTLHYADASEATVRIVIDQLDNGRPGPTCP